MSKVSEERDIKVFEEVQERLRKATRNKLLYLDLNDIDVSYVINFSNMFNADPYNTEHNFTGTVDISKWDTSNAKSMMRMFYGAEFNEVIGLSELNTSQVTIMDEMFMNCNIKSPIDISGWDVSKVGTANYMFCGCKIPSVGDLSKWVTSNLTEIDRMFELCKTIDFGDLTKWDVRNAGNSISVFARGSLVNRYRLSDSKILCIANESSKQLDIRAQILDLLNKVPESIKEQGLAATLTVMQNMISR